MFQPAISNVGGNCFKKASDERIVVFYEKGKRKISKKFFFLVKNVLFH